MGEELFDTLQEKGVSLAEQVAEQINQLVVDRNLQTGEKLPNEFELAQFLNVGRGTIREAEKLLVARNVLEIQRGKGTFVALNTGEVSDPLGLAYLQNDLRLAEELVEIRLQLEPGIAALAAERATAEDITQLVRCCDTVENLINQGENHLKADKELHQCIANCTHNRVLPKLIPVITYSVELFGSISNRSLTQETIQTHRRVVNAIIAHDADAARQAMYEHIEINQNHIQQMTKEQALDPK
jgi:DNA-binding FadR family transcriptional regulator